MNTNTLPVTPVIQRRGRRLLATSLLGLLFCAGGAAACVEIGPIGSRDVLHDKMYDTYPDRRWAQFDDASAFRIYDKCSPDEVAVFMTLDMPGLTYEGDVSYKGKNFPAYAAAPDGPLILFAHHMPWSQDEPLRIGTEVTAMYQNLGTMALQYKVWFLTRGGRMRTALPQVGSITLRSPARPELDHRSLVSVATQFPATTCPVQDKAETLQDVPAAELSVPGSTAKEKRVALRMDCGVDPPRARMTLSDAGDAGNTGSQLSPTGDSDAEGVRVQLLRNGSEVQFGQNWDFDPGTGGVHEHPFTARYIRTHDPLVPGAIKGEAILNVDYW